MLYRRSNGDSTWHFCQNCAHWPQQNCCEQTIEPPKELLCAHCVRRTQELQCDVVPEPGIS